MTSAPKPWRARKPELVEYGEWYANYVALAPHEDIVHSLGVQLEPLLLAFRSVPAEWRGKRYDSGKWTPEELVGHVVDTERVFAYRAMLFTRGHGDVPLVGVDQDVMVDAWDANRRGLESLTEEFESLRRSNVALFDSFTEKEFDQRGTASGKSFSVRALLFIVYGHARHHADVLERTTASAV